MCWWMLMIVLMTCVDVLMCWVGDCVDVLMCWWRVCWCIDVLVGVFATLLMRVVLMRLRLWCIDVLVCSWLCWTVDVLMDKMHSSALVWVPLIVCTNCREFSRSFGDWYSFFRKSLGRFGVRRQVRVQQLKNNGDAHLPPIFRFGRCRRPIFLSARCN
jgi:hypothetical protein